MNLRGWSCWMLPSRPDPTRPDPIRSNPRLDHSRSAKVHSRRLMPSAAAAAGASMSVRTQGCLTSPTISRLAGRRVHRPSGSAARCPALCGEELPPPPPHARKEGGKGWMEGRCRIYSSGSAERRINTDRIGAVRILQRTQRRRDPQLRG